MGSYESAHIQQVCHGGFKVAWQEFAIEASVDSGPHRPGGDRCARVQPQLVHDVAHVVGSGVVADREAGCDLLVGAAVNKKAYHLQLTRREFTDRWYSKGWTHISVGHERQHHSIVSRHRLASLPGRVELVFV